MNIRLILPALVFLLGCSTSATERLNLPELPVVQHVDVDRYLGTWYEIASFPQSFQEGCTATTATYKLRDDGQLDVINRCNKGGLDGKEDVAEGRARIVDSKTNAKLEVSFFRPFWGDYWIIDLADDYSYAVVGHPGRDYLWILSRTRRMAPAIYDGIIERLKGNGYEVERLNKTLQPETEKPPVEPAEIKKEPITLKAFKENPPASQAATDSVGAELAKRLFALDLSKTTGPDEVLRDLRPPTAVPVPYEHRSHVIKATFETPEGPVNLSLFLKKGTWEPPKGNSAPRPASSVVVEGVEITGANGLALEIPSDAQTMLFDGESVRRFHVWGDNSYFEQGSDTHGWTVAKYVGRAPFHSTAAERDAMEDALILLAETIQAGTTDLQVFAAKEFAARKTEENTYDFGVGVIHVVYPESAEVGWYGDTQIPKFFNKLKVRMINTSFAHDAGQMVEAIRLDKLVIHPSSYHFGNPDSSEDEMGMAAEAKIRGLYLSIAR
jgi:apolipoprotein D and lipocalin family protein